MPPSGSRRAARRAPAAQSAAHQQQVELLRLTQLAEQTSQRREQLSGERPRSTSAPRAAARRAAGESRFEALDAELGVAQERMPSSTRRRAPPSAPCRGARGGRSLERHAQEAQFEQRSLVARAAELERSIATAAQQLEATLASDAALVADLER
jgi:chromosome segregation protein